MIDVYTYALLSQKSQACHICHRQLYCKKPKSYKDTIIGLLCQSSTKKDAQILQHCRYLRERVRTKLLHNIIIKVLPKEEKKYKLKRCVGWNIFNFTFLVLLFWTFLVRFFCPPTPRDSNSKRDTRNSILVSISGNTAEKFSDSLCSSEKYFGLHFQKTRPEIYYF